MRVIVLLLSAFGVACVNAATAEKPMSIAALIDAQLNAKGALRWSRERQLTTADFKGTPPQEGPEGAHTEYTIVSGARCSGRSLEFKVATAMLPSQSWVMPELTHSPADLTRTLKHEQTHFDISEVYARKIRRRFADLYDPCALSETALQAVSDELVKSEAQEQLRYDDDTNNGRVLVRQSEWDRQVAAWLESLNKYGQ
jgi:hypothetical protein